MNLTQKQGVRIQFSHSHAIFNCLWRRLAQGLNPPGKHASVSAHDEANTFFAGKNNDRMAG